MYIDYDYYTNKFCGEEIPESEFNRLEVRAADLIDNVTFNRIPKNGGLQSFAPYIQGQIKKAVAAQLEYIYVNGGTEFIADGGNASSITIGKFSIGSKAMSAENDNAGTSNIIAPAVKDYLFDTGLLYRGVGIIV